MKERFESIAFFYNRCMNKHTITVYAAQASFYIAIATVPFLMLLLSIAQFLLPLNFENVSAALNTFLPKNMHEIAYRILSELFTKSKGILSISLVAALWTSSRGAAAIERGVRLIYHGGKRKGFINATLYSALHTVVFIAMILATLIILVFGPVIVDFLSSHFTLLKGIFNLIESLRSIVLLVVLCFFFAFVYRFFSGKKVRFVTHLPGAAFSSLGWVVFSLIYAFYIENFSNYSYIYGSLTAIVLSLLWLYFCMIIFLLGAEINVLIAQLSKKGFDTNE